MKPKTILGLKVGQQVTCIEEGEDKQSSAVVRAADAESVLLEFVAPAYSALPAQYVTLTKYSDVSRCNRRLTFH